MVSALHIGLTSLDPLYFPFTVPVMLLPYSLRTVKILKEGGVGNEKAYATVVLPIIERHHWLLVSLVIVTSFGTLSLFLST